ncbi:MAG: PEP/pyruvate-binding domain-containing protein [Ancrocorticia sp.]|uniref:PEP/pyruvate-binding domain-containing protein n=1 Tax=Ancrocorticia sp. TaxID=2593684 RepID=UPI003F9320B7
MIKWFDNITSADTARVGGKGANLGECARAGLPVPPGFCVSTDAYREATRSIAQLLAADATRRDAEAARHRILELSLPEAVRSAISDAYVQLGEPAVAVRSSATAEDLADASFAGQQDTYLGVIGIEAVLDAVRHCWASLWTDRAVDYRRQQGVSDDGLALAVVIQEMVAADTAGVLFTRDPVTGDDSTMLASSSYGLGESVVAALVTPDMFTLSRSPAAVVAREIGSKDTRIDPTPDGGTTSREVAEADRSTQSVTDNQLLRLIDLGERVEAHYGTGQDIEWGFSGHNLYLLQARPITTSVTAIEGHAPVKGRFARFLRDDVMEHFPAPFPLDLYAVHKVQGVVQNLMHAAGLKAGSAEAFVQGDEDGIIRIPENKPRPSIAILTRLPRLFAAGMSHTPTLWTDEEAAWSEQLADLTNRFENLASGGDTDALELIGHAVEDAASITADRFLHYLAPMMVNRTLAAWFIKLARLERAITPEDLYVGVQYKTADITRAINGLAAMARESGVTEPIMEAEQGDAILALSATQEGRSFQSQVSEFLAECGARTARLYLPFSNRSWREDPEIFYALLASTLRGEPLEPNLTANAAQEIEQRLPGFLRKRWRTNTAQLRARHIGREGTVYLIEEFFCVARAAMDEIARRLVHRKQLDDAADIRFLYFEEVENALRDAGVALQPVVAKRRRKRGTAEAVWWGRVFDGDDDEAAALRGLPASAGQASGTARVIHSPQEFHRLQPGDILVCPYTDPTWTPLFALAAAVVADSGGPLSHAAIVAREYGIPAVLGTGSATSLPDGATVLVDGAAGTVTVLDGAQS